MIETQPKPSKLFNQLFKKQLRKDLLWIKQAVTEGQRLMDMNCLKAFPKKDCKTPRCIGGWLWHLMVKRGRVEDPERLELEEIYNYYTREDKSSISIFRLFFTPWPKGAGGQQEFSAVKTKDALVGIDHFIEKQEEWHGRD